MAFTKKKVTNILIIVLSVFIILPLILILFNINPYRLNEGMTEYNMSNKNTKMDRVDASVNDVGVSGEHIYCYGGDLVCPEEGYDVSFEDVSYGIGENMLGSTAKFLCYDNTGNPGLAVECSTNSVFKTDRRPKFISHDGLSSKHIDGNPYFSFTNPYSYIPLEIKDSYVILYDMSQNVDFSGSSCFLYQKEGCYDTYVNSESGVTEETNDDGIPCLADNNAKVGEHSLCCGQEGVLQSTQYNCPSTLPYCKGYKCGDTWGRCQATND